MEINNPKLKVMDLRKHANADHASCCLRWSKIAFTLISAHLATKGDIKDSISSMEPIIKEMRYVRNKNRNVIPK